MAFSIFLRRVGGFIVLLLMFCSYETGCENGNIIQNKKQTLIPVSLLQRINDLADLTEDLVHGQLGVDLSEARARKV